jgi:hypothetical protein
MGDYCYYDHDVGDRSVSAVGCSRSCRDGWWQLLDNLLYDVCACAMDGCARLQVGGYRACSVAVDLWLGGGANCILGEEGEASYEWAMGGRAGRRIETVVEF